MSALKAVQKGFTLIEVMIVVAIIGIIASIALPSYTDYVEKGRAAEATTNLATLRIQMEQYFQDNRTYEGGTCAPAQATYFSYACSPAADATTYTLVATGLGNMSTFSFDVDESNEKNSTYHGVEDDGCWKTSKTRAC